MRDAVYDAMLEWEFLLNVDGLALEGGGVFEEGVWVRFKVLEFAVLDKVQDLEWQSLELVQRYV